MKKTVFLFVYVTVGILSLYYLPRLLAWLFYKTVAVYVLLSVVAYILFVVGLYRLLKKCFHFKNIRTVKTRLGWAGFFLFYLYIAPLRFAWTHYDWHFHIDNGTDERIEIIINNKACSVSAKTRDIIGSYFHCPAVSIECKGQSYHFEKPGDYVFNIDALNSYYLVSHEVRYSFADVNFTLTDHVTDTIRNQLFFRLPHHIDNWFEYPEQVTIRIKKDKRGKETKREKPKYIYSIQRISEYELYKIIEQLERESNNN